MPTDHVSTRIDSSGPDDVYWLSNRRLTLGLVPALGGRLLSFQLDGRELLYRNPRLLDDHLHRLDDRHLPPLDGTLASWRNYGGDKTWPAPQGWSGPAEWAGPPDPVLDSGCYQADLVESGYGATLTMTSADDLRSGLRLSRTLALPGDSTEFTLEHRFTAVDRPVEWAIWNILQLCGDPSGDPTEGWYAEVDSRPNPVIRLLSGNGFPRYKVTGGVVFVPCQPMVGKLGVPGATGRISTLVAGVEVYQRFSPDTQANYTDRGSRAEIWLECPLEDGLAHLGGLKPDTFIIESEVLGPLVLLKPGQSAELIVTLGAGRARPHSSTLVPPAPEGAR